MGFKLNFTSLENSVFFYLSLRFFTEGVEEFLIQPTAWYYINYLGESDLFLGLTLASYSAAALLFAPFAGILEVKFQAPKGITLFCTFVRFFGNLLYTIPINGYFPLFGRFISGLGAAADGVLFAVVAKCTTEENHGKAFLYLEGLFCLGTICGPTFGSALIFNIDIYGWKINEGNSPGFVLVFVWFALLLYTQFLPSDLTAGNTESDKTIIEEETDDDLDLPPGSITTDSDISSSPSPIVLAETSVFKEESADDNLSNLGAHRGHPSMSMVVCLYYLIFVSLFVYMVISFYVPLLARYHIGLGLSFVKLIYINSTLSSSVLFFAAFLFLKNISEHNLLFLTVCSEIIPLLITLYFGIFWNNVMSVNEGYLLLCSMLFLSAQYLNTPLAASLLAKITPKRSASFYQSLAFAAMHLGFCLSRLVAGATFAKIPMIYTCCVLVLCWLFGLIWLGYEHRKFTRVINNIHWSEV